METRTTPKTAPPIIKRVAQTIDRYGMFAPYDKVLVGVSGGPDSVALLQILQTLSAHYRLKLAVAHLDHGLRPKAAKEEADHVARLASELRLDCHMDRVKLDASPGSLEERARRARYDFFDRLAERHGYPKIALGHHVDDNAESVLMHLLRGSGIRGLAGIPPVRDGRIVRPLIHTRRAEIMDYLQSRHLTYALDRSNDDLRFSRNRIRHHLIPLLQKTYNPNIVSALQRTADLCWEEDQWFQAHLSDQVDDLVASQSQSRLELDLQQLASVPLALQRRLIRDALRRWQGNLRRLGADHIEAIVRMLCPTWKAKRVSLPNRWQVERTAHHLRFSRDRRQASHGPTHSLKFQHIVIAEDGLPMECAIPEADGRLHLDLVAREQAPPVAVGGQTELFDLDCLTFPLIIRNFRQGDRLQPFGMQGSQKLKQLFSDRKIPRHLRRRVPLLVSGDQIAWVAGVRRGRAAPISPATTRVMVARWRPEMQNQRNGQSGTREAP